MKKLVGSLLGILFLLTACAPKASPEDVALAEKITRDYYAALNAKDYQTMYDLISEGFKKIEPTAATYEVFEAAMSKFFDTAKGVRVLSTDPAAVSANEIIVNYVAEITLLDGSTKELKSAFTVKKKPEGWRLIHPYGGKKDLS